MCIRDSVQIGSVYVTVGRLTVAGGAFGKDRRVTIVAGVFHTERIEDVLLQHLLVRFTRDALDDGAEKKITGVVVGIFRARLELKIAARILLHEVIYFVRIPADVLKETRLAGVTRYA